MTKNLLDVPGFNVLIKARYGYCLYNKHDIYIGQAIEKYGEYGEVEAKLFKELLRPGMTVIEAGANIGTHTQVLSQVVGEAGHVIAFEPQRVVFQALCANMALNNAVNTDCYPFAVGDTSKNIIMPMMNYHQDNNFGGVSVGLTEQGLDAKQVSLDDFLDLSQLHFIKIDVEGMEEAVIKGASGLIQSFQPMMYVENDRPEKSQSLIELLWSYDYDLFWHLPKLFNPENFFGETDNVYENIVSVNMLCVPKTMKHNLPDSSRIQDARLHPMMNQS